MSSAEIQTAPSAPSPLSAPSSSSSSPAPSVCPLSSSDAATLVCTLTARFATHSSQSRHLYLGNYASTTAATASAATIEENSQAIKLLCKVQSEYESVAHLAVAPPAARPSTAAGVGTSATALAGPSRVALKEDSTGVLHRVEIEDEAESERTVLNRPRNVEEMVQRTDARIRHPSQAQQQAAAAAAAATSSSSTSLIAYGAAGPASQSLVASGDLSARHQLIAQKRALEEIRPEWHAPWKLMRVISSHQGWVRAIAVDHSNEWFATGSVDRTIKIFDLASGNLKLTLTGHVSAVRGLAISALTPYMFSVGEDKRVKCWDMQANKVIRDYHGHLSGIYCVSLLESPGGPNVLVTGGRDSVARVWDIRTASEVAVLGGHTQTVASVVTQTVLPQVITGSHDTTIRLWDLRKSNVALSTLTHHKKSVRALQMHHTEYTFASGAGDNIKVWRCPEGSFLRNISGHNATINALALNRENVFVSAADNGSIKFWDYKSGHSFQTIQTKPQPGSLDAESGVFAMTFDKTGSRLFTAETDKSIKVWKEDENATEESHPIDWRPSKKIRRF